MKKKLCKLTAMIFACLLCVSQPGQFSDCRFMLTTYAKTQAQSTEGSTGDDALSAAAQGASNSGDAAAQPGSDGINSGDAAGDGAVLGTETLEPETEAVTEPAVTWPVPNADIQAGSAIVMDADTTETLWGREIHTQRYPASVTKLLTALIVIENCDLDETVTFSTTAVSNLESGAVTIGAVAGDTLSVRDCLYALLLKSANEVANALAEHVAGSVSDFAVLMNKRAEALGCQDSNFKNPSGLTDSEHVTSAYDMGLIAIACMNNATFMELESEPTRKIGGTKNYPNGLTVTIGHKMRKSGEEYYDSRVVAGKTGYTSTAGNTLVTMAEDHGRRVVVVVLKDKTPAHYTDTKSLINFGLDSFEIIRPTLGSLLEEKKLEQELLGAGVIKKVDPSTGESNSISLSSLPMLTVPVGGSLACADVHLKTKLPAGAPENAVAQLYLSCQGHEGPCVYVLNDYTPPETENEKVEVSKEKNGAKNSGKNSNSTGDDDASADDSPSGPGLAGWILIILLITVLGFAGYLYLQKKAAKKRREERRRKRKERMERLGAQNSQEGRCQSTENSQEGRCQSAENSQEGRCQLTENSQEGRCQLTENEPYGRSASDCRNGKLSGNAAGQEQGPNTRTRRHSRIRNKDAVHSQEELALLDSLSGKEPAAGSGHKESADKAEKPEGAEGAGMRESVEEPGKKEYAEGPGKEETSAAPDPNGQNPGRQNPGGQNPDAVQEPGQNASQDEELIF